MGVIGDVWHRSAHLDIREGDCALAGVALPAVGVRYACETSRLSGPVEGVSGSEACDRNGIRQPEIAAGKRCSSAALGM